LLGLPSRDFGNGARFVATLPRIGRIDAERLGTGGTNVTVNLPARANLDLAMLVVHADDEADAHTAVDLRSHPKIVSGDEQRITVPWNFGPGTFDHLTLLFADRPLAKVTVSDTSPAAHAYLNLDPGCERLGAALMPVVDGAPAAGGKHEDAGKAFEQAAGTLFAILGFHVTPLDQLKRQGDWYATLPGREPSTQLLIECSLQTKDVKKLKELEARAHTLARNQRGSVYAVLVTPSATSDAAGFDASAAGHSVRVVRRDRLEKLLALVMDPRVEDRIAAALDIIGVPLGW
jgi:hypothetical protein